MHTPIAEDLLLLLLDDARGTLAQSDKIQPLLGGALLLELALAGRVEVAERTRRWTSAKVVVTGTPPGEPLLDEALSRVAQKPRTATHPRVERGDLPARSVKAATTTSGG